MKKKVCKTCLYHSNRTCHRYPPVSILAPGVDENYPTAWWPDVDDDHWCGEYKPRKKWWWIF